MSINFCKSEFSEALKKEKKRTEELLAEARNDIELYIHDWFQREVDRFISNANENKPPSTKSLCITKNAIAAFKWNTRADRCTKENFNFNKEITSVTWKSLSRSEIELIIKNSAYNLAGATEMRYDYREVSWNGPPEFHPKLQFNPTKKLITLFMRKI